MGDTNVVIIEGSASLLSKCGSDEKFDKVCR